MPTEAASQIANKRQDVACHASVQPLTAAEAEARRNIIADVEAQCASHGRHPAEWDVTKSVWISPDEPAAPYAIITTSLAPPKRCREVICELLGAGLPVASTAHQAVSNPVEQKRVVKAARKLVHALREGPGVAPHVTAAVSLGILQPGHRTFCKAVQARAANGEDADVAADAVVRRPLLLVCLGGVQHACVRACGACSPVIHTGTPMRLGSMEVPGCRARAVSGLAWTCSGPPVLAARRRGGPGLPAVQLLRVNPRSACMHTYIADSHTVEMRRSASAGDTRGSVQV